MADQEGEIHVPMPDPFAGANEGSTTNNNNINLEGDIENPGTEEFESTLDEPVLTTLGRDAKAIFKKFYYVLLPHSNPKLLHDWDLWGPLLLTVTLAFFLRGSAPDDQKTTVFTGVFFIIWTGSVVVTINNKLLGGNLSFFQGICVLGYCVLPLVISCILLRFLSYVVTHVSVRMIVVAIGFAWSIMASIGFLGYTGPSGRRALIVYPIVLFYFVISWLVLNDVRPSTEADVTTTTLAPTTIAWGA